MGEVRHIGVSMLWMEQNQRHGEIGVQKVDGESNPADMCTKSVPTELMWRHMKAMRFERREGRGEATVKRVV